MKSQIRKIAVWVEETHKEMGSRSCRRPARQLQLP